MEHDRPINVMHIIDNWSTGGVQRVILNISEQLLENGHNVCILSYFDDPDFIKNSHGTYGEDRLSDITISAVGFKSLSPRKAIRNFYEALNKFQPDIIHDHYGGIWSSLFLLSRRWKKRAVFHTHNEFHVVSGSPDKKRIMRNWLFLNFLLPGYSHIITVSDPLRSRLIKDSSALQGRFHVVHNSINIKQFLKHYSRGQKVKEDYGISGKYQLLIGIVGRLVYEKGQDTVIDVLWHLRQKGIDAAAMIVGDGDLQYLHELKHKAENLNVAEHCFFTGHVDNTADYYQAMDIYLFCSRQEPFGLTLLEAMACRVPIVAVKPERTGGPEEILEDGYNSMVMNSRDPELMAQNVKKLYNNSEFAGKLVEGGNHTLKRFTNSLMYQSLSKIYNRIEQEIIKG